MGKNKRVRKPYRPREVHQVPMIMLGQDVPEDSVRKHESIARDLLLKLHFRAEDKSTYDGLIREIAIAHRLAHNFEERKGLVSRIADGMVSILELEFLRSFETPVQVCRKDGEGVLSEGELLTVADDTLRICFEVMRKASIIELLEAVALFDTNGESILADLRRLARRQIEPVSTTSEANRPESAASSESGRKPQD